MARIKIELPSYFPFTTKIPVRITDINYGNHVGNDAILSIIHEARMQFLGQHGFSEMNVGGTGMIMCDVGIEFKSELFYGDTVIASVTTGDFSRIGFDIFYKFEKLNGDKNILVASAKTGMICFDYSLKKIVAVPDVAKSALEQKY